MDELLKEIEERGGTSNAPQPAGQQVAEWYRKTLPSMDEVLHVLAISIAMANRKA